MSTWLADRRPKNPQFRRKQANASLNIQFLEEIGMYALAFCRHTFFACAHPVCGLYLCESMLYQWELRAEMGSGLDSHSHSMFSSFFDGRSQREAQMLKFQYITQPHVRVAQSNRRRRG